MGSAQEVLDKVIGSEDFDHLVYIRLTEACNAYCEHCFIPKNPKKMEIADVYNVSKKIISITNPGDRILIQFHGGEPTILGVETLTSWALNLRVLLSSRTVLFGIQTNLISFNEKWVEFYKEYCNSTVGVSYDTDIRYQRNSGKLSKEKYEQSFEINLRKLVSSGLTPYVVMTATKPFFNRFNSDESIVDWAEKRGVEYIHIETLTHSGYAVDNWNRIGVTHLEHSLGMSMMYRGYKSAKANGTRVKISPFDGFSISIKSLVDHDPVGYGCLSGKCDSRFHTFDANGYQKGCTALTTDTLDTPVAINVIDLLAERSQRTINCSDCMFTRICNTGCLANQVVDSSNECSGHKIFLTTILQNDSPRRESR